MYAEAVRQHQLGNLSAAEQGYQAALEVDPNHAGAMHLWGVVKHQRGQHLEALALISRALALRPDKPVYLNNCGGVLLALGRVADAHASFLRATELAPTYADAWANLGLALWHLADYKASLTALDRAAELAPTNAVIEYYRGNTLAESNCFELAIAAYQRAAELNPRYAEAHNNLGRLYVRLKETEKAAKAFQAALACDPQCGEAGFNLGALLDDQGQTAAAAELYARVLAAHPENDLWRLRFELSCAPVLPNVESLPDYIVRAREALRAFGASSAKTGPEELVATGTVLPYHLQAYGLNEKQLRSEFAAAILPHVPRLEPKRNTSGRLHLGVVFTAGHEGIFIRCVLPILQRLDPEKIRCTVVGPTVACESFRAQSESDTLEFIDLPPSITPAVKTLLAGEFDVLYHWEPGTDAFNQTLALHRLAPLQCTSSGMQCTSGSPTIDEYISSAFVETADADNHYTERLIRLSSLLLFHTRLTAPTSAEDRPRFGLPAEANLYLCVQNLIKVHPDMDVVLANILRRDPRGIILFSERAGADLFALLTRRWQNSMADVVARVKLLPKLTGDAYLHRMNTADVILDTFPFGSGSSCYDSFSLDLPLVTMPTQHNRGRYALACYTKIGLDDLVAKNPEEYVSLAVRLGADREWRQHVRARLAERSGALFDDWSVVQQFEEYFVAAATRARH